MNHPQLDAATLIKQVALGLDTALQQPGASSPLLVGIHTGGAWVAEAIHDRLPSRPPVATLEVAFHRDDHATSGLKTTVQSTLLPTSVDGQTVVLIDDVIHTGRTCRAALNALFDYGRPERVLLAVLVDRGGRQLPIQPDVLGVSLPPPQNARIKLLGPEPLHFVLEEASP